MKFKLTPNKCISSFIIGSQIDDYLNNLTYIHKQGHNSTGWENYYFYDEGLEVYVDKETRIIESITCRDNCYLEGTNLIGLSFDKFWDRLEAEVGEWTSEKFWMSETEQQTAYNIDGMSLQIWVNSAGLIVSVSLLNFSD